MEVADKQQAEVERKVRQLEPARFKQAEYERTAYVVTAFENTDPEDLLNPAYWAHVAAKLKAWDRIEARANDGTWLAEYLVLGVDRAWAKLAMLNKWALTTPDVSLSQDAKSAYEVYWNGPADKWSVKRTSDQEKQASGFNTKGEAQTWVTERLKADR